MFSEFNVRAEVSQVETLDVQPIRKARMLLRIAKQAAKTAGRLSLLSQYHYRIDNPLIGARFREAAQRLVDVQQEVRLHARNALVRVPKPLGYGYTPRGNAYPSWSLTSEPARGEAR